MAKRYRPVGRDQPFLFPPDMRDWLPPGHPVWLVITVVEDHLDTSAFRALRRTGGAGAAGYDPDMLVTVLVWAYAHQVTRRPADTHSISPPTALPAPATPAIPQQPARVQQTHIHRLDPCAGGAGGAGGVTRAPPVPA